MNHSSEPLVSVITPFYNAAQTLRYSLSSLLMQKYQNWECVLVDDGSEDDPGSILDSFRDPRIRYFRLDQNRGRGAARQFALEKIRGDYLAFLDADDWIYPTKLGDQVEILQSNKDLQIVSSVLALVDQKDNVLGIQGDLYGDSRLEIFHPIKKPGPNKIPFASSMISREAARDACFDPNLTRSEDADFLLQLLLKYSYGLLHKVLYIYKINLPLDYRDMQYGYQSRVEVYKKFLKEFPFTSGKVILSTKMKQLLFWFVHQAGMDEHLIQKRPRELKNEELKTYHENLLSLKSTF